MENKCFRGFVRTESVGCVVKCDIKYSIYSVYLKKYKKSTYSRFKWQKISKVTKLKQMVRQRFLVQWAYRTPNPDRCRVHCMPVVTCYNCWVWYRSAPYNNPKTVVKNFILRSNSFIHEVVQNHHQR